MFVILVMKDSIYLYNEEENKLLSRTISFIRFPLCVLVVILHSDLLAKPIYRLGILDIEQNAPIYTSISWFFSRYLAYSAVPIFFIISGFLFFYNIKEFTLSVYKNKLVTRVKSLFIPYLCWCLLYFLLYILIGPDNIVLRDESKLFDNDFSWFSFVYEVFIKPIDGPFNSYGCINPIILLWNKETQNFLASYSFLSKLLLSKSCY